MIFIVTLYALLAATFTIAKKSLEYGRPIFIVSVRMLVAGGLLLLLEYMKSRKLTIKKSDWLSFFKASLFHIYFAFVLEFWALQYMTSAKTTLIYSATPFIAAFLAYFLLQEHLSNQKKIGMAIGTLGLIPILMLQTNGKEFHHIFEISLPEVVLLGSVFSATYGWFLVKDLMNKNYHLLVINGISMFIGGILALATSAIFEIGSDMMHGKTVQLVYNWPNFLLWVGLLTFTANVLYYNLYGWLLRFYSITFVMFAGFLCPVFGALFGWFFLGEYISPYYFLSLGIITLGLFIYYKDELTVKRK